jgi:DNA-binding NarL/FixJ family response regulator
MSADLQAGRAAFARRQWTAAHAALSGQTLDADDAERLAVASFLLARDDESARAWERAHQRWLAAGDVDRAARCACWLALTHLLRGDVAVGSGWLARSERMIDDADGPCASRGLLLVPALLAALGEDDCARATAIAEEMLAIGQQFADEDVIAFGLLTCGEAALASGDLGRGMRLFDEVMVKVLADEVSPVTAGIVYCAVIEGCMRAFDLQRAAVWTEELRRWCAEQPDLVPYRGQCLVHRAQVLLATGAWHDAASEADRAAQLLSDPAHPALAIALYQRGELHRVRGEHREAERAYREASGLGYDPLPGLALLRLAEGELEAALALADRMLEHPSAATGRAPALAAAVDVLIAAGDVERAESARDELSALAEQLQASALRVAAAYASGVVDLGAGAPDDALVALRAARDHARDLDLPYEEARARAQAAVAYRAVGDDLAAEGELDAAVAIFERLGARADLERARALRRSAASTVGDLSDRECEVLRQVAGGSTNREVAEALHISEHTVARHLQNIFAKLGVRSRSAATAYAYESGLVAAHGPR